MAGVGDAYDDTRSPDDVTISVARETGNQITIVVGIVQDRSNIFVKACKTIGRAFSFSCKQAFRRKYTLLFLFVTVVCIGTLGLFFFNFLKDGAPTTNDPLNASNRLLASVGTLLVLAPFGFYIINLRLIHLIFGITWMFGIVAIVYFLCTSLVATIRFNHFYNGHNSRIQLFDDDVAIYMKTLDTSKPGVKFPLRFRVFMHNNKCCDFQFSTPKQVTNTTMTTQSFWDYIFLPNFVGKRPAICCGYEDTPKRSQCFVNNIKLTATCNADAFLGEIAEIMQKVLGASVVFILLCLLMAFVFWYYYSDLKEKEFAKEEQPGDYELLTTTQIHEDDTENQVDPKTQAEYDTMLQEYYSNYELDPNAISGSTQQQGMETYNQTGTE